MVETYNKMFYAFFIFGLNFQLALFNDFLKETRVRETDMFLCLLSNEFETRITHEFSISRIHDSSCPFPSQALVSCTTSVFVCVRLEMKVIVIACQDI